MGYKFNVEKVTEDVIAWIKDWFENNGKGCNAVIGISGEVVELLHCLAASCDGCLDVLLEVLCEGRYRSASRSSSLT